MVSSFALSIFLLPIVTVFSSQFWNDLDKLRDELSDPEDLPTQATPNEDHLVEPTPSAAHHASSTNEMDEIQSKRKAHLSRRYYQKNVSVSAAEAETFIQEIIIDESYPQIVSLNEIEAKLLALGQLEEWFDIDTYDIEKYPKYWAKVCLSLWGKQLDMEHRYLCTVSPSYGIKKKRAVLIKHKKRYFDFLYCKCYNYENNYKTPLSPPETFLIHKSGENEFYIFEQNSTKIKIHGLKGGITLPEPHEENECATLASRYIQKLVTLSPVDMRIFNQSITIDKSYPENISYAELEEKLMKFEEVNEWPDLKIDNLNKYSLYWGNLCVLLWDKKLDQTHRQACVLSTSYGDTKIRSLFLGIKPLHFDLLGCKCHSYISNFRKPISTSETFLIHRGNANEFYAFEQRATCLTQYTLFIKGYKRIINPPDQEAFK